MKKIIFISIIGAMFLAACETIEKRETLGPLGTASDISVSATATESGGNQIVLKNNSASTGGTWYYFGKSSANKTDTIIVPFLGDFTIQFVGTTAGGLVTVDVPISITTYTIQPDPMFGILADYSSKTWVWDDSRPCWGNGGYMGCTAPCWWTNMVADMAGQGAQNDEITFDLYGGANATLVAETHPSPGTHTGVYDFDMSESIEEWSIGKLYLNGVIVPMGVDVNNGNAPFYTYDILVAADDELVLCAPETPETGGWGTSWFYMLVPKP